MAVLVAQPLLYKYGYPGLHRKIGRLAVYLLVPLLILGGIVMIRLMVQGQADYPLGSVYQSMPNRCWCSRFL